MDQFHKLWHKLARDMSSNALNYQKQEIAIAPRLLVWVESQIP